MGVGTPGLLVPVLGGLISVASACAGPWVVHQICKAGGVGAS